MRIHAPDPKHPERSLCGSFGETWLVQGDEEPTCLHCRTKLGLRPGKYVYRDGSTGDAPPLPRELRTVVVGPDDKLLIVVPETLSDRLADELATAAINHFGPRVLLVVGSDIKLGVVKA